MVRYYDRAVVMTMVQDMLWISVMLPVWIGLTVVMLVVSVSLS